MSRTAADILGRVSQDRPTYPDHIRLLRRVRQVRELAPDPVPDDVLRGILEVARWTGSARNQQPWGFVVVRDRATMERIGGAGSPIAHAARGGVVIVIAIAEGDRDWARFDEARVAERILIAATGYGLGAAIGWIREPWRDDIRHLLGIPSELAVRTLVSIGYPTEQSRRPKAAPGEARRPFDDVVHWERWR